MRCHARHQVHRRQAQRVHPVLDLLGVSSLVDMVNAAGAGTPSSVLGPFHIEGAPELLERRRPVARPGRRAVGRERPGCRRKGAPAKGTVLALWQNAGNAPSMPSRTLRRRRPTYHARLAVADDGSFAFTTVRPVSPTRCRTTARPATCCACWASDGLAAGPPDMIIQAPGHAPLITEFFPEDDKYLDGDAVFGVRAGLVLPFGKVTDRAAHCRQISPRVTRSLCRSGRPGPPRRCPQVDTILLMQLVGVRDVSKVFASGVQALGERFARHRRRRVFKRAGPVGLREVDVAPSDSRASPSQCGRRSSGPKAGPISVLSSRSRR